MKNEKNYEQIIIVIGILADKEWKLMLDQIVPVAGTIIATKPNSHRALEPAQIKRYLEKEYGIDADVVEAVPAALERARRISGKQDLIVVTGSFYTVGEIYRNS